jgi:hypothetical protein
MTMFASPANALLPLPVITPWSEEAFNEGTRSIPTGTTPASLSWGTANRVAYYPFRLDVPRIVVKGFCINGATLGNVPTLDIGVYDQAGHKLVSSGATAATPINTLQELDLADTQIGPGAFFIGLNVSWTTPGTAHTVFTATVADEIWATHLISYTEVAGSGTLPTTATFAKNTELSMRYAACGIAFDTVI